MTAIHLKPLDQQIVVVVGATSGIGREATRRFAMRGAGLVLAARSAEDLAAIKAEALELGAPVVTTEVLDVADPGALDALATNAVDAHGRIDTWAHVAGVDAWSSFADMPADEIRRVIEVNLLGVAYGLKAALPRLREAGGGAAIVVSSLEGQVSLPDQAAYAASKHGVDGLVRAIRMELADEGAPIALAQILPASIGTPLFEVARTRLGTEPRPIPPVYDPAVPADLIVHAAEHPSRELYAGGAGWLVGLITNLLPRASEAVLARVGRRIQRTGPPKSSRAAANLEAPVPGQAAVRGEIRGRRFSLGNALQMTPVAARVAVTATVGALLLARWRRH